jgi:hypothetical protein
MKSAAFSPTHSVRYFAELTGTTNVIDRAISFDERLLALWNVPVKWNYNLKNSAGFANIRGISLHPGLKQASETEFRATFLHELAHVCEGLLYNDTYGHSQHWWEAMIRLGEKPWINRHHNIVPCMSKVTLTAEVEL